MSAKDMLLIAAAGVVLAIVVVKLKPPKAAASVVPNIPPNQYDVYSGFGMYGGGAT